MKWISLFSGAGCGDLGIHRAGHEVVAMVENDQYAASIASYNFPDIPIYSDVSLVNPEDLPQADALLYSFPCQDLSNAGNRKGFSGDRSSLYEHAVRIIQHLRTTGLRYSLAENVCGLLSSNNGRDFERLIGDLLDVGHSSIGWTILDSRYVGFSFLEDRGSDKRGTRKAVPQRRRRVFVLGSLGDIGGETIEEILSLKERSRGYLEEVDRERKTGESSSDVKEYPERHDREGPCYENHPADSRITDSGEVCPTLTQRNGTGGGNLPYVATGVDVYNCLETGDTASTLTTGVGISNGSGPKVACSWNGDVTPKASTDVCMTLRSQQGGEGVGVAYDSVIRKVTPIECERLQGLPDDFTGVGNNLRLEENRWIVEEGTKSISDSQRYKILGNAITAHVTEWLARKIELTENENRRS
jgi:DNA (cytosine-5)-methyltransferase 1